MTEIDLECDGMAEEGSLAAWQTAPYLSILTFCSVYQVQREPHFLDWLGKEVGRRTEQEVKLQDAPSLGPPAGKLSVFSVRRRGWGLRRRTRE